MRKQTRLLCAILFSASSLALTACGKTDGYSKTTPNVPVTTTSTPGAAVTNTAQPVTTHHSKLAGAAVGAAAGHVLGGHAVAGAAVGALIQHERNKHRKY